MKPASTDNTGHGSVRNYLAWFGAIVLIGLMATPAPSFAEGPYAWAFFPAGDDSINFNNARPYQQWLTSFVFSSTTGGQTEVGITGYTWGSGGVNGPINGFSTTDGSFDGQDNAGLNFIANQGNQSFLFPTGDLDNEGDFNGHANATVESRAIFQDGGSRRLHRKILTRGGEAVVFGSGNFTNGGYESQGNNWVLIRDNKLSTSGIADDLHQKIKDTRNGSVFVNGEAPRKYTGPNGESIELYLSPDVTPGTYIADVIQNEIKNANRSVHYLINFISGSFEIENHVVTPLNNFNDDSPQNLVAGAVCDDAHSQCISDPTPVGLLEDNHTTRKWSTSSIGSQLHHKLMIIDQDTIITGSANFTASAMTSNSSNANQEITVVIKDFRLARQFMMEYRRQMNRMSANTASGGDDFDLTPPQAVSNFTAENIKSDSQSLQLSWTAPPDPGDFTRYYIFATDPDTRPLTDNSDICDFSVPPDDPSMDPDGSGSPCDDPNVDVTGFAAGKDKANLSILDNNADGTDGGDPFVFPEAQVVASAPGDTTSVVLDSFNYGGTLPNNEELDIGIVAVDDHGNESNIAIDTGISRDVFGADIQILNPKDGHDTRVSAVNVDGIGTDVARGDSVTLTVNGADTVTTTIQSDSTWAIPNVSIDTGANDIRARIHDSDENSQVIRSHRITVRRHSMEIGNPADGADTGPGPINVSGTSHGSADGDVVGVTSGSDTVVTNVQADESWLASSLSLTPGPNSITATIYEGDTSTSVVDTDVINVRSHDITATYPVDGSDTIENKINLIGESLGSLEGDSVSVQVQGDTTWVTTVTAGETWSVTIRLDTGVTNSVTARVHEGDSTTPILDSHNISIRHLDPTISFSSPTDGSDTAAATITARGNSTDAFAGDSVTINSGNDTWVGEVNPDNSTWAVSGVVIDTGLQTLVARLYYSDSSSVQVDTTSISVRGHEVRIDTPVTGSDTIESTIKLGGRSEGTQNGDSIQIAVNGTTVGSTSVASAAWSLNGISLSDGDNTIAASLVINGETIDQHSIVVTKINLSLDGAGVSDPRADTYQTRVPLDFSFDAPGVDEVFFNASYDTNADGDTRALASTDFSLGTGDTIASSGASSTFLDRWRAWDTLGHDTTGDAGDTNITFTITLETASDPTADTYLTDTYTVIIDSIQVPPPSQRSFISSDPDHGDTPTIVGDGTQATFELHDMPMNDRAGDTIVIKAVSDSEQFRTSSEMDNDSATIRAFASIISYQEIIFQYDAVEGLHRGQFRFQTTAGPGEIEVDGNLTPNYITLKANPVSHFFWEPLAINLSGNARTWPNPFTPAKDDFVRFQLPNSVSDATIRIYDITGALIERQTGVNGQGPNFSAWDWDGTNQTGQQVSSGTYIYYVKWSGGVSKGEITLIR